MAYSGKFGSAPKSGEKMKLSAVLEKECQETFASVPVPSTWRAASAYSLHRYLRLNKL